MCLKRLLGDDKTSCIYTVGKDSLDESIAGNEVNVVSAGIICGPNVWRLCAAASLIRKSDLAHSLEATNKYDLSSEHDNKILLRPM